MNKRTAREINVNDDLIENKGVNVKIGTVENRDFPETVYISLSFWADCIDYGKFDESKNRFVSTIENLYDDDFIKRNIFNNRFFGLKDHNIYIPNIPLNLNFNNKPSFVSIDLYLNTYNIDEKLYPLSQRGDTELYDECLRLANLLANKLKYVEDCFYIYKKQKKTA